jgi:lipopolysaccharide transport system permease protein
MTKEPAAIIHKEWDLEIKAKTSLFDLHLKDIWRYKYLLFLFVKRDFIAQYKQTILGPLWHVLQPAITSMIFMFIFGRVARIPTDGVPPILFYLSGITLWNYFSACFTNTSNTFVSNAGIFGKVYFPRLILPLSVVFSNIVRLGIQLILLTGVIIYFHFNGFPIVISPHLLLIPVLILLMAGIGLGMGIIVSSLTTKYRDLTILVTFGVQLLMYATPVVYPLSYLANTKYETFVKLNPLTGIVESFRYSLFKMGTFNVHDLLYSFIFMSVVLIIGVVVFNRVEKSFMDTV